MLFTCIKSWFFRNHLANFHQISQPASVAQLDAPSDWRPGGRGFNPRWGRQHSFVEIDHEIFSTVIFPLPLIQEGQLSVSGERMCTILVNRLEGQPRWLSWMRRPTGDQEVAGSTPAEVGNILSWRLIMKYFLRSFSPFRWFKKGSCQFLAEECAQCWLTA